MDDDDDELDRLWDDGLEFRMGWVLAEANDFVSKSGDGAEYIVVMLSLLLCKGRTGESAGVIVRLHGTLCFGTWERKKKKP
mmetsp:Transcript_13073/g.29666  ORF Transcript_13073/g.29666 Transcript_13073/m.29666 type:complete len:81 (+) Transcript_13073:1950-2192(+)